MKIHVHNNNHLKYLKIVDNIFFKSQIFISPTHLIDKNQEKGSFYFLTDSKFVLHLPKERSCLNYVFL